MNAIMDLFKTEPVLCANIIALAAAVITFISYQVNSSRRLLVILCISAAVSGLSFAVLGAWTGVAMNGVVLVRNIVYYNKDRLGRIGKLFPILFALAALVFGVCTWDAWFCAFSVIGLIIDCLALSSSSAQFIRGSILVTAPMFFVYDLLTMNYIECVKEIISLISVVIGIARFGKARKTS